jgi:hypothetical protein
MGLVVAGAAAVAVYAATVLVTGAVTRTDLTRLRLVTRRSLVAP